MFICFYFFPCPQNLELMSELDKKHSTRTITKEDIALMEKSIAMYSFALKCL